MTSAADLDAARDRLHSLYRTLAHARRADLGFPNAIDLDLRPLRMFLQLTLNNVGYPGMPTHGFTGHTLEFEHEVVQQAGKLLRAPAGDVTGLVTSGSTAAIAHALLHARDRFGTVMLYMSAAAHTCVRKVAHHLRIPCTVVPAHPTGEIDYTELSAAVTRRPRGAVPIVVATIGTTMWEAIDDVGLIHTALDAAGVPRDTRHVHADGALAGLALAGLPTAARPGFDFADGADSFNISGHKFLAIPEPCGILVIRTSACAPLDHTITYTGAADLTMAGSRSGHAPLALWWALRHFGPAGLHARAETARSVARQATHWLIEAGVPASRHEHAFTVVFPKPDEELLRRWPLAVDGDWAHIVCMPGKSLQMVRRFVADYTTAMPAPPSRATAAPSLPAGQPADVTEAVAC